MTRPPLAEQLPDVHYCPHCTCAVNVEDVACLDGYPKLNRSIALMYCDSCGWGFTVYFAWIPTGNGGWYRRLWHLEHAPGDRRKHAGFLRRLGNAQRKAPIAA